VNSYLLSVAELWWRPISPISSFGILWKVKSYFHTFRAKSFFFIENGNLQQPLYSTHGTSPVLDSSLWLAVSIDSFFTEKVKEMKLHVRYTTLPETSLVKNIGWRWSVYDVTTAQENKTSRECSLDMEGFFFVTLLPVLSGYLVLGQTSGYQHYEFFLKKIKIYIFKIQEIDCVDSYVFNHFNFPLTIMNESVFKC
jgi:hypothetical protein